MRIRPRSPLISRSFSSSIARYQSRKDKFNFNDSLFDEESIPKYSQFKRVTALDLAQSKDYPKNVTMLVRDFIQDSLYNPHYGYFSKQAIIFSSKEPLDFLSIRDSRELETYIAQTYGTYGSTVRGPGRQVWHTPTELFKVDIQFIPGITETKAYLAMVRSRHRPIHPIRVHAQELSL